MVGAFGHHLNGGVASPAILSRNCEWKSWKGFEFMGKGCLAVLLVQAN